MEISSNIDSGEIQIYNSIGQIIKTDKLFYDYSFFYEGLSTGTCLLLK